MPGRDLRPYWRASQYFKDSSILTVPRRDAQVRDAQQGCAMLLIRHYVAPSPIHGLGVFAAEPVAAGALIWIYDPRIDREIPRSELAGLPDHVARRIHHHAEYYPAEDLFILSSDGDGYMNHDDDPNVRSEGRRCYARRAIAAGEELTCDYREITVIDFDTGRRYIPDAPPLSPGLAAE
jgi:hypothetical protein